MSCRRCKKSYEPTYTWYDIRTGITMQLCIECFEIAINPLSLDPFFIALCMGLPGVTSLPAPKKEG